ncbi:unnamed protein product, partial [Ectocarpus sp. 4 AP-2014]
MTLEYPLYLKIQTDAASDEIGHSGVHVAATNRRRVQTVCRAHLRHFRRYTGRRDDPRRNGTASHRVTYQASKTCTPVSYSTRLVRSEAALSAIPPTISKAFLSASSSRLLRAFNCG